MSGGAPETRDRRAQVRSADCKLVAAAAEQLASEGATLPLADLSQARSCIAETRSLGRRMGLARDYLALIGPDEGPGEAEQIVREVEDPAVRDEAFRALGRYGKRSLPTLVRFSRHRDSSVRWLAYARIRHIGGEEALPVLVEGLSDAEAAIRWTASNGLIDARQAAVIPVLRALVEKTPTVPFHRAAARVLRRRRPAGSDADVDTLLASLQRSTTVYESGPLAFGLLTKRVRGAPPAIVRASAEQRPNAGDRGIGPSAPRRGGRTPGG